MTASVAYLDASAATKLIVAEPESFELAEALATISAWVSSVILDVELRCVAQRLPDPRQAMGNARALLERCDLVAFSGPIRRRAGEPWTPPQRALDAIHLATAQDLHEDGLLFVSYDRAQIAAAEDAGLTGVSPG